MKRMTKWFTGCLLAGSLLAFAQEPQLTHKFPEDALTSQQLIAWSWLQKPQPAPQPLPPRDTPIPQADPQNQSTVQEPGNSQAQEQSPSTQSFTGKIVKDGTRYVLKVASNTTYQLDEQGDLKQYENRQVKIIGNLDTGSNTIRVVKIELLS
jgi:hypothetical protein